MKDTAKEERAKSGLLSSVQDRVVMTAMQGKELLSIIYLMG